MRKRSLLYRHRTRRRRPQKYRLTGKGRGKLGPKGNHEQDSRSTQESGTGASSQPDSSKERSASGARFRQQRDRDRASSKYFAQARSASPQCCSYRDQTSPWPIAIRRLVGEVLTEGLEARSESDCLRKCKHVLSGDGAIQDAALASLPAARESAIANHSNFQRDSGGRQDSSLLQFGLCTGPAAWVPRIVGRCGSSLPTGSYPAGSSCGARTGRLLAKYSD